MALANALHGPLAWLLLALIASHVVMVAVHRWVRRDDVLGRMAGAAEAG
jgi:cytochrome b561